MSGPFFEVGDEYELVGDEYELVGDDGYYETLDYTEDDLDALLGFSPRVMRRGGRARRGRYRPGSSRMRGLRARRAADIAALAARKAESAALVRNIGPRKNREFPIGFDSVAAVAAGAAANIQQQPQIIFRPERIVVPAAVAAFFQVTDVRVGKDSQLVSAGALPAATFAETAFGVRLKMDTCQVSQLLILQVLNFDVAAHRFMASIIGESVEFM